jgi:hypothetical protein
MAAWTTIALVTAAVVAAGSASYSAYASVEAADDAKKAADEQAVLEREAAAEHAKLVSDQADRLKSEQRAVLAASGVDLANGGGGAILQETDRLAEQDALSVLRGGNNQSRLTQQKGNLLAKNYNSQAVSSSLLSGASAAYKAGQPAPDVAAGKPGVSSGGWTAGGSNTKNYGSLLSGTK